MEGGEAEGVHCSPIRTRPGQLSSSMAGSRVGEGREVSVALTAPPPDLPGRGVGDLDWEQKTGIIPSPRSTDD